MSLTCNSESRTLEQLKAELIASELRFNNVVQNSPDGIVVTDTDGFIQYVNPASEFMFGRNKEALIGQSFGYPVMSGDTTEIEVLHPGKPHVVAEMRVVQIEWEGETGMLATLRDMSERIQLTNDLKRSNKDLESFASVVSHDIRAPLRNLHLLAGWLQQDHAGELNSDAMEDIELMRKTTTRMQRMVDDLLQYSRTTSSEGKVSTEVQLEDVLADALDILREDIFRMDAQIINDPLPTIDCNIQQMVALFRHIISNAIAYCPIKPRITITADCEDDICHLKFHDNGIGVEEKYWEKIFVPFNHLHSKDTHDGSGIGLATCKKIVDRHNGKIWLESESGVGSVVHVQLPHRVKNQASGNT